MHERVSHWDCAIPWIAVCLLGQISHACTPHANLMHGIGLGKPVMSKSNATSWTQCCDFCSGESTCVAWTYVQSEKVCLLRAKIGTKFDLKASGKVSGIMKPSYKLTPKRNNNLLIHLGILSAPQNRAKVMFDGIISPLFYFLFFLCVVTLYCMMITIILCVEMAC